MFAAYNLNILAEGYILKVILMTSQKSFLKLNQNMQI